MGPLLRARPAGCEAHHPRLSLSVRVCWGWAVCWSGGREGGASGAAAMQRLAPRMQAHAAGDHGCVPTSARSLSFLRRSPSSSRIRAAYSVTFSVAALRSSCTGLALRATGVANPTRRRCPAKDPRRGTTGVLLPSDASGERGLAILTGVAITVSSAASPRWRLEDWCRRAIASGNDLHLLDIRR